MTTKSENQFPVRPSQVNETVKSSPAEEAASGKKAFVEPEVSFPIDVLEATTFFLNTDSGDAPLPPLP